MGKIKKLLINHGEKIGMAVVALIVLAGLAGTDWVPYDGTPGAITQKVSEAEAKWVPAQWPEEEATQFTIKPEDEPKAIVAAHIGNAMPLSEFMLTQKFARSPYEQTAPLKNPEWMKLEAPIANGGRVLLAVVDEEYQKEMELFQQGLGPDGKPLPTGTLPGGRNPMDDNIPDEFRQRPTQALGGIGAEGVTPGMAPGMVPGAEGLTPGGPAGRGRRGRGAAATPEAMPGDPYAAGMMEGMGMPGAAGGGLPAGQTGRGFHYISVRAVFPLREQIYKVAEATNVQPQQGGINLEILDYQIERQTKQESGDPWGGPWEPVDINTSADVLTKMSVGLEPDVVYTSLTDPAMTMPLPARVSGQWMKDVTHPRIEKFTLTPEQIQQEVRFQQEALRRLEELKKELPPPPAQKAGWSNLVISGSQLTGAVMGGGAYGGGLGGMGGYAMPEMSMGGGMGAEMGGMSPYGAGGGTIGAPGTGKPAPKVKSIEELLNMKDKDLAKELADYVDKVVTAAGELLLFRYIDFSVEPGKTYRYRARLVFRNPNFGRSAEAAGGDTTVVTGETRTSDWCEPTTPEMVQKDQQTFVTDVRSAPGTAYPTPQLNVFQWDAKLGSLQQAVLNVKLGQTISGKARIDVLDPAKASFETKEYAFQSTDYVVDAQPDVQLEASAHPDVKAVGGSRGDLMLPEQVLVALSEGGVSILDPSVSRAAEQASKRNLELQNEYWKNLKESQNAATDPLAAGSAEAGVAGEMMYEGGYGMSGRGLSPLSSRNKKNRRPAIPMGP
ncbi:hypothetical protein Pan44_11500 [Caulifigura coniformis]|uniref:Uncharacterized protein n=1 Tax=Caulifigura coniformis TaxID=2527983 RepID=A0A517SAH3_9PLAN|nr:hypothetical protein [Caulifigura coniformis]QDT53135.1 hypothetical protein Pan44_11500 [Caulifigura coniformis]